MAWGPASHQWSAGEGSLCLPWTGCTDISAEPLPSFKRQRTLAEGSSGASLLYTVTSTGPIDFTPFQPLSYKSKERYGGRGRGAVLFCRHTQCTRVYRQRFPFNHATRPQAT